MEHGQETQSTQAEQFGDELTLVLRKPISVGDQQYAELQLSEPTAKQLREAEKAGGATDQMVKLISLNAKVPLSVVDGMVQRDLSRAASFFGHFGDPSSPSTGSSPT